MISRLALIAVSLIAMPAIATAQGTLSKEEQAAISISPESVFDRVEVKGVLDQLDPTIWVSTQPFATKKFTDDKFLRAHIEKATGKAFYQIYIQGSAPQSLRFDRMTYIVEGKLQTAKVSRVYFDVSCQRYGCSHYEDFVVDVPREHLRALADEGTGPFWRGRLFGQVVDGVDIVMLRNETTGFLTAIDRIVATLSPAPAE